MVKQTALGSCSGAGTLFPSGWQVLVYDNFDEVQARWRIAQSSYDCYAFQTYEWLSAWQQHLGSRQGWQPRLVEVQDETGQTGMLFPLGVHTHKAQRTLGFLGGEVTDYNGPIVNPAFLQCLNKADFNQLWQCIVMLLPPVDIVAFKRMPTRCGATLNPMTWIDGMDATEQAHAATLPQTYAAFQETRSAKMFADTRRQLRRLAEMGQMTLSVQVADADRDSVIAAMAQQKSRRWQETGCRDLFLEDGYLDFYRHLASSGMTEGEVVVSGLQVNGQWIATHWGVRYDNRFYWLMPGYENDIWARYSPGRVLLDAVVQWSIEQKLAVFDLTVGDEGYKRQWADHVLPLYAGSYGVSTRGKWGVWRQQTCQALRTRAKEMTWLRHLVRHLRGRSAPSK